MKNASNQAAQSHAALPEAHRQAAAARVAPLRRARRPRPTQRSRVWCPEVTQRRTQPAMAATERGHSGARQRRLRPPLPAQRMSQVRAGSAHRQPVTRLNQAGRIKQKTAGLPLHLLLMETLFFYVRFRHPFLNRFSLFPLWEMIFGFCMQKPLNWSPCVS